MNKRTLITSLFLLLSILSCNLPASPPATQVPVNTEPVTVTPERTLIPTLTSVPTETPLPTLTPTPTIPIAWPLDKGVNCRYGPSTNWISISSLLVGQTAEIQGRNKDSSWWYVTTVNDPGKPCWVASSVTVTAGNLANLQVVDPPIASVTDVSLKLEPKEITLPGCIGPMPSITFKGGITVNGPAKVEWHFETEQGGALPYHNIEFEKADTKTVEENFTPSPPAGSYWVKLIITKPNEKKVEIKYKITCP